MAFEREARPVKKEANLFEEEEDMERLKADEGEVRMLRTIEPKEVLTPGRMSKYRSNGGRVHTEGGGTKKGSQFG